MNPLIGRRVRMITSSDRGPAAPVPGAVGTVVGVDAVGVIHVDWENGCLIGLLPGVDLFEIL